MAERWPFKPVVEGSNPSVGAYKLVLLITYNQSQLYIMNALLSIAYWIAVVQYIYNSLVNSEKCRFLFLAQLTFWIGVGWAVYFSLPNPSPRILFALIVTQFVVTIGRVYEIRDMTYVKLNYDTLLFHWIGFIIAVHHLNNEKASPDTTLCAAIFTAYIITFLGYSAFHKKELISEPKCIPERFFNIYTVPDRYHIAVFSITSLLIYFMTASVARKRAK